VPTLLQVGIGKWGLDWTRKVLPEVPEMKLVACVDTRPEAIEAACRAGVIAPDNCYSTIEEALKEREVDAVLVTTELTSHADIVRGALRARKHVLVEKPFAGSMSEARQLTDEAAALNRTLMVSQNYRFFPAPRAAQDIVRSEELGRLVHVDVDFRRFNPRSGQGTPQRQWAHPLLLDMAIHHFDLMRAVLGREPRTVDCRAWNPPGSGYSDPPEATAIIDFADGITVSYRGSWLHPGHPTAWAGEWLMEFEQGTVTWTSRGDRSGPRSAEGDTVSVRRHGTAPVSAALPRMELMDRAGTLDAFTRALETGTTPESTAQENLGSLALAYAAIQSASSGEPAPARQGGGR
jgi:predicted dehydrogenase